MSVLSFFLYTNDLHYNTNAGTYRLQQDQDGEKAQSQFAPELVAALPTYGDPICKYGFKNIEKDYLKKLHTSN